MRGMRWKPCVMQKRFLESESVEKEHFSHLQIGIYTIFDMGNLRICRVSVERITCKAFKLYGAFGFHMYDLYFNCAHFYNATSYGTGVVRF